MTLGRRKEKFRQRNWGSNPGPLALRTSALTTELSRHSRELRWTNPPYTSPMSMLHCWVTAMPQSDTHLLNYVLAWCSQKHFMAASCASDIIKMNVSFFFYFLDMEKYTYMYTHVPQARRMNIAIVFFFYTIQLNWIVLHGEPEQSQQQQQASAGVLQAQWSQLVDQQKAVVSTRQWFITA